MKIFFLSFFVFCTACDIYTIHNQFEKTIIAGWVTLRPNQCIEFFDFPLIGDFPLKFRYKDNTLISETLYLPNHYMISSKGEILKQDKACKIERVGKAPLAKDKESTDQESTDQESTDQESTDQESTDQESTDQESTDQESTDQESTDQESTDQESTDQESTDQESTDQESTESDRSQG